jgi:acetylornithine deacetylase
VIEPLLDHLRSLVAFDTRNPPRAITTGGVFEYLTIALPGFDCRVTDHGAGAVSLFAVRGRPTRLFNVHLDTVPVADGWTRDPFRLEVADGRAYGLGACDTKGAAAALLVAAAATRGDAALLFSSDEEANDPRCIRAFLGSAHGCTEALVAEPTRCRAVTAHRGIVSAHARFAGTPGHASEARALADSAVHRAVAWANRALTQARACSDQSFRGLVGLPFNIGTIAGGIKGNVIAPSCELRVGFRPLPSQSVDALLAALRNMAPAHELVALDELFRGPPLPAAPGADAERQLAAAEALARALGLEPGPPVDFWTEASLFSAAGLTALVYGPGDIAQAHGADEWVELAQLDEAARTYARLLQ